jgi:hypothetical protein
VRLHSKLLGEDIICIEDGEDAPVRRGLVCYTRNELNALQGLDAAALRAVHQSKKLFGGKYIGPTPASTPL